MLAGGAVVAQAAGLLLAAGAGRWLGWVGLRGAQGGGWGQTAWPGARLRVWSIALDAAGRGSLAPATQLLPCMMDHLQALNPLRASARS
jgi:hypothetical protein